MSTKTIRQSVLFSASPHAVFELLMDQKKHATFTGCKARVERKVGGRFSFYDGDLQGFNLELVKDKRIIQAWRCVMPHWRKDHYSIVDFALKKSGKKTKLTFTHYNVPSGSAKDIAEGWKQFYWEPMKALLVSK